MADPQDIPGTEPQDPEVAQAKYYIVIPHPARITMHELDNWDYTSGYITIQRLELKICGIEDGKKCVYKRRI